MAKNNHGASVGSYILIALILGVITYVEYAIVEFPQAWLGSTGTLVVLAALSVLKFILVVMFFMHLKGDDRMYSGFFSSGMIIALATFIALTALFILPRSMSYDAAKERTEQLVSQSTGHGEPSAADRAATPAAADRSASVAAPEAANDGSAFDVADEAETPAAPVAAGDWDRELGAQVFSTNCVGCHQAGGAGMPGVFPPLAGHVAEVYANGGRDYLVQVLLFGLQGQIQVQGTSYSGFMPGWTQLSDDQIANLLNHLVVELGDEPADFTPYTAADVAAHRGDGLAPAAVYEARSQLGLN